MIRLTPDTVRIGVRAATRDEAIRAAGGVLVEHGYVDPRYVEGMLRRERQASTFLGSGIAIPHGLDEDRGWIRRTGVALVQLAEPVEWAPGRKVRVVVAIAARSDEHLGVLAALADVLDDPARAERLACTADPGEIVAAFARGPAAPPAEPEPGRAGERFVDVRIEGEAGLHARPAIRLAEVAARFDAVVRVQHGGRVVDARSLASLLRLGVRGGETVRLLATGPDAEAALAVLRDVVRGGLGEEGGNSAAPEPEAVWEPVAEAGEVLVGLPASPGLAIGPLFRIHGTHLAVDDAVQADGPEAEKRRLAAALEAAHAELDELFDALRSRAGAGEAAIFHAQQALLDDPDVRRQVEALIDRGHAAAWAWDRVMQARVADMRRLRDARFAGRAADLHDVAQRVLRALVGAEHGAHPVPDHPVVLVADDLVPSDAARLDPERVLGLCTASGGSTSHTAILARSLGIPVVAGAGPRALDLPDGATCILDGSGGRLFLEPGEANLQDARRFQAELRQRQAGEWEERFRPALLADGHRVEVAANIGRPAEAAQAVEAGADGIGLMRTEFLFLDRAAAPTEEEQLAAYTEMTRALNGLPLVVRTLDIGGDKHLPYLPLPAEANPFLGIRGIRLCLRRPDLFLPQLRAVFRAAATGPVKIMFPMVATVEELREAREIAERVRREVGGPAVEIGIMVEVPSAVLLADELAREADFFSVGTNDLTQYTLAIDRLHPVLGAEVDAVHPAVLRMIDRVVRAADRAGRPVGVCGGVAGEPLGALILTGLGVRELSMSVPAIPAIKALLRRHSHAQLRAFAQAALGCATAAEVRALPLPAVVAP
jgi:multiphosphoryl transfer protein